MAEQVSIIVAVKNSFSAMRRMVESSRQLSLRNTQLVIVDGGSKDDTVGWLRSAVPDGQSDWLWWDSASDSGIAEAWNRGLRLARGRWVLFLGADDHVTDAVAWNAAIKRLDDLPPECGVAAFPVRIVTATESIIADEQPCLGPGARQFPAVNAIPHQGAFHRRGLWEAHGAFDTSFAITADYEFLLRIWTAGVEIRPCGGAPPVAMTFGGKSKLSPLGNVREFGRARRLHDVRTSLLSDSVEFGFAALRTAFAAVLGETMARRLADWGRRIRGLPPVWDVP